MLNEAAGDITRIGLREWSIGTLPKAVTRDRVTAYPALVDAGNTVDVRLFETEAEASTAMLLGTRRLLLLQVPSGARSIADRLPNERKLAISRSPYPGIGALLDDCAACAADQVIADAGGPAWDADGFARLATEARDALPLVTARVVDVVAEVLEAAHEAEIRLQRAASPPLVAALADARGQFAALIYPRFVSETGLRRLPDLVRYLRAISRRLDTAAADPGRDATRMAVVRGVTEAYQRAIADLPATRHSGQDVQAVRWMIEELRVSLVAQLLGTSGPVSEKRIHAALDRLIGPR
jgi:ATP-dependent helicase HrpA